VVGEVVRLREKLNWFESRPLFGTTVLVTRPASRRENRRPAGGLWRARPHHATIAIVPPADWRPLDRAIGDLARYDW